MNNSHDEIFLKQAVEQAMLGASQGGLPIGASLAIDGKLIAVGHNKREQLNNPILHAEMDCLANAGKRPATELSRATLYSSLSPCWMCAGAAVLFGIKRIVIADDGEGVVFVDQWRATKEFFATHRVELIVIPDTGMITDFRDWIRAHPTAWAGDVGG